MHGTCPQLQPLLRHRASRGEKLTERREFISMEHSSLQGRSWRGLDPCKTSFLRLHEDYRQNRQLEPATDAHQLIGSNEYYNVCKPRNTVIHSWVFCIFPPNSIAFSIRIKNSIILGKIQQKAFCEHWEKHFSHSIQNMNSKFSTRHEILETSKLKPFSWENTLKCLDFKNGT